MDIDGSYMQQTPYGFDIQALANYRVVPATCFRCAELYRTLIAPMFRASQADNLYPGILLSRTCLIIPPQLSTLLL